MTTRFFDTSALVKHYHSEVGSAAVDALLVSPGATAAISRLAAVELHSALAKRVRAGEITAAEFDRSVRGFRADLRAGRFRVVRLLIADYNSATRLIIRVGRTRGLKALDALQLAVALRLNAARPVTFVCADQALCSVTAADGLAVVNPESP